MSRRGRTLPRSFYARDARELAPLLLNKVLVRRDPRGGRLAACASWRSRPTAVPTTPAATPSGPNAPQRHDVRAARGTSTCTSPTACTGAPTSSPAPGDAAAVLLRAAAPLEGLDVMRARRTRARADRELCAGPARLCQAFGITGADNRADLVRGAVRILDDGVAPPATPLVTTRVGLAAGKGDEHPWRFVVPGDPHISRGPRSPGAGSVLRVMAVPADEQLRILSTGAVDLITEADLRRKLATGRPLRAKLGIDPTASDIHLGFAVVLRKLRQFQELGHTAVLIIGDFTAQVGDPSGSRPRGPASRRRRSRPSPPPTWSRRSASCSTSTSRSAATPSGWAPWASRTCCASAARTTVARMLERDDFSRRHRDGRADLGDGVPLPAAPGLGFGDGPRPTSSSAAPTSCSTTSWAAPSRSRRARRASVLTTPLLEGLDGVQKMSKSLGNFVGIAEPPGSSSASSCAFPTSSCPLLHAHDRLAPRPHRRGHGCAGGR